MVSLSHEVQTLVGLGTFFGLGIGLSALHGLHVLQDGETLATVVSGVLIPALFSVGVLTAGVWLWRRGVDGPDLVRVAVWSVLGAVSLSLGSALVILHQRAEGISMAQAGFVIAGQASLGSVIGYVVGFYDMRRRTAMHRTQHLTDQLSVLNRVLRHDIRNDANVIQGRTSFIEEEFGETEDVEIIKEKADNLVAMGNHARLIERILRSDFDRSPIDFAAVLDAELTKIEQSQPAVTVDASYPDEVYIAAHPMIDDAVGNILENAVQHNESEHPRIEIECWTEAVGGEPSLQVRIRDNGPGIPSKEIDVLERGYETPLEHTSGLGLWLINWLVRESDGEIWFEENDPSGSEVCLRLHRVRD